MKHQIKKKPRCNSANSSSILTCVQLGASNGYYSNMFLCCTETLRKLGAQMRQELELLAQEHFDYWSGIQTESLLDQYKALVLFNNKEGKDG